MDQLFDVLRKLKEDRSLSSKSESVLRDFIGQEYLTDFSFISSARTFSLRYDKCYSNGYTVTALIDGMSREATILFSPDKNNKIEELKKDELFKESVFFIEYDSLYERPVFGTKQTNRAEALVKPKWVDTKPKELSVKEVASELDNVPMAVTGKDRCDNYNKSSKTTGEKNYSIEVDGILKIVSDVDSINKEIKEAKNYWVFMPGPNEKWPREFVSYIISKLPVNDHEKSQAKMHYEHRKGNSWKEKSFNVSAEEACEKLNNLLLGNKFNKTDYKLSLIHNDSVSVVVDWGDAMQVAAATPEDTLKLLRSSEKFWSVNLFSDDLSYSDFIQFLNYDDKSEGVLERWRAGIPIQRIFVSPEIAIERAEDYLHKMEYLCPGYYQLIDKKTQTNEVFDIDDDNDAFVGCYTKLFGGISIILGIMYFFEPNEAMLAVFVMMLGMTAFIWALGYFVKVANKT
ncbi:MAG: hypothetical protein ACJ0IB_08080 [Verrucomicrobiales bacterium]